jgi:hypothetical protein
MQFEPVSVLNNVVLPELGIPMSAITGYVFSFVITSRVPVSWQFCVLGMAAI